MNPCQFNVTQLKQALKDRKLPTCGRKDELILRLQSADLTGEWMNNFFEIPYVSPCQSEIEDIETENIEGRPGMSSLEYRNNLREHDFLRRENDLLVKELELARRENELLRREFRPTDRPAERERHVGQLNINMLRELLSDFDGSNTDCKKWRNQFKLVCETHQLDDNFAICLFSAKLKGQALQWFQSKTDYISMSMENLLLEFMATFDCRPTKLSLRKKFEKRLWKTSETFTEYFHDKFVLGNTLSIEEDEMIEYIIEGIPDVQIRNQAIIQRFRDKASFLKAFQDISLHKESAKLESTDVTDKKIKIKESTNAIIKEKEKIRCYNCNKVGHLSVDCKQPKREKGACFNCFEMGHQLRDCPKKLSQKEVREVHYVNDSPEEDAFNKMVEFKISNQNIIYILNLVALLDSGSPISFIKETYAKDYNSENAYDFIDKFAGVNGSRLIVLGSIKVSVKMNDIMKNDITLLVVPDNTMMSNVVLGRDILKIFNLTFCNQVKEKECDTINAIFNIDMQIQEQNIMDSLNINEQILLPDKIVLKEIFNKYYVLPERPDVPEVKAELKLFVKDTKPIFYQPRQLSFTEKESLQVILKDWEQKGIIRHSDSEYASPIVLVKKKKW